MAFRIDGSRWMRFTLGAKLAVVIATCGSLSMIALALVFLRQAQISADEKAQSLALEASRFLGDRVEQDLNGMFRAVSTTNRNIAALWSHGFRNREEADTLLADLLMVRRDRFGAWMVWHPNAFDGRDADFAGKAKSDGSGRLLTYWRREGTALVASAVSGYADQSARVYRDPLDRSATFLSEPYDVATKNGGRATVISFAEPIVADGKTLGAIGLDIALDDIARGVAAIPHPKGAAVTLVSTNGTVVSTNVDTLREKSLLEREDALADEFREARTRLVKSAASEGYVGASLRSWRRISLGSSERPWYLLTDIPWRPFAADATRRQVPTILAAVGLLVVMLAVIFAVLRSFVTRPLARVEHFIETLRTNDAKGWVDTRRSDEIGSIARALGAFGESERKVKHLQAADAQRELDFSENRRRERERVADDLASSVQAIAALVGETSGSIMQRAQTMASVAAVSIDKTRTIVDASAAARTSVQEVDGAATALRELIDVINVDLRQAGNFAADAATRAKTSSGVTVDLSSQASRIGDVVAMISSIATRTNLLALNATIEAARAGDAGRGFAVVAQEVKALAAQTSAATQEIASQIDSMQRTAADAADALTSIGQSVEAINEISVQIASATQWQSDATARIGSAVASAVDASNRVTDALEDVDKASTRTGNVAAEMLGEIGSLSNASVRLNEEVFNAITRVRAS